jgi:hypothetical protein
MRMLNQFFWKKASRKGAKAQRSGSLCSSLRLGAFA